MKDYDIISIMTGLQHLNLSGCKNITDLGLQHLSVMSEMQNLNLWDCEKVTDAGLQHIAMMTKLSYLCVCNCHEVTDIGLHRLFSLLQHLDNYRHVTDEEPHTCMR
jgi:hypothetical protein